MNYLIAILLLAVTCFTFLSWYALFKEFSSRLWKTNINGNKYLMFATIIIVFIICSYQLFVLVWLFNYVGVLQ
jgi:hypothetical protein